MAGPLPPPMPVTHYENFPVASVLLPHYLRQPIAAIYWFARSADDLADEGDHPATWRLAALDGYGRELDAIAAGVPGASVDLQWQRLRNVIAEHRLPLGLFRDLLNAFAQDVVQTRYSDFAELERYCRRSANPVGRLLLHLFGQTSERDLRDSDAICTSLQLLNFCQDAAIDWQKDRIYFPQDEMRACGVTEAHFAHGMADIHWQRLFMLQLDRALASLRTGSGLAQRLPGRSGLELRAIVAGGERIGARLRASGGDVFRRRPLLTRGDWVLIMLRALRVWPAARATVRGAPAASR